MIRRPSIVVLCILIGTCVLASGCAGERVAITAAEVTREVATGLANKIPITSGMMRANGSIENPAYNVEVLYVQGVKCHIALDGAKINGELYGQGEGGNNTYDPAFAELLERAKRGEPGALDKLLDLLKSMRSTSQPSSAAREFEPVPKAFARANQPGSVE